MPYGPDHGEEDGAAANLLDGGDHFNSGTDSDLRIMKVCGYVRFRAEILSCPTALDPEIELISRNVNRFGKRIVMCSHTRSTRMKTSFHRLWLASPSSDSSIMMYATFAITWNKFKDEDRVEQVAKHSDQ